MWSVEVPIQNLITTKFNLEYQKVPYISFVYTLLQDREKKISYEIVRKLSRDQGGKNMGILLVIFSNGEPPVQVIPKQVHPKA